MRPRIQKDKHLFFLLDEPLPDRKRLPQINQRGNFNIRHIVHDYRKSGLSDDKVIQIARKENRIIVTVDKTFGGKKINQNTSVVKIPSDLSPDEIGVRLFKLTKLRSRPADYRGKIIRVEKFTEKPSLAKAKQFVKQNGI